ncbi:GNAT family N-acetyltransferase [Methylobacterium sp. NEAU 140]|uniref:GNAT family N-acetyltransferase n=1 Tax=Methylobacterium sp. NEAU 140 TaxID=3064945 RepID=UPI002733E163|nr:GNAT family N-acetyltransferase [Methylobacterium sp. NEAU 140]MDP4021885.1 GNAT family N-acetyltransferase [Methylobacterium sp. NEAU 140]
MLFEISDRADAADAAAVADGLLRFNESELGPSGMRALTILVRGPETEVGAGLIGRTAFGWLFIEKVWVGETLRGRGVGRALVDRAETEARARGCTDAWLDTFNPQAHDLYRRLGYEPFGQIERYVGERTRFFLRKVLREDRRP